VRFDPRERCVICATALVQTRETIVGIGAIKLGKETPDGVLLVVDEELTGGLAELLQWALLSRARQSGRTRAA
jgi:hypothetical protein